MYRSMIERVQSIITSFKGAKDRKTPGISLQVSSDKVQYDILSAKDDRTLGSTRGCDTSGSKAMSCLS